MVGDTAEHRTSRPVFARTCEGPEALRQVQGRCSHHTDRCPHSGMQAITTCGSACAAGATRAARSASAGTSGRGSSSRALAKACGAGARTPSRAARPVSTEQHPPANPPHYAVCEASRIILPPHSGIVSQSGTGAKTLSRAGKLVSTITSAQMFLCMCTAWCRAMTHGPGLPSTYHTRFVHVTKSSTACKVHLFLVGLVLSGSRIGTRAPC